MSSMLSSAFSPISTIENFFKYNGDKRVAELRFMDSPWEVIMISSFYVYFCYDLGPHRLMKNREAFDLVWTVRIFNSLILLLNVWLLTRFFSLLNWGYDSMGCAPVNENDRSAKALEHINVCHLFLYSRILELVDTLWIILRKKNRQVTFLHVFHHSFVLLMTWFYFKIAPGGSSAMFPIVNGCVHTIMYTYYILSTFDTIKPYLWWKKYVTTIQLIQFIILGVHFSVAALTPNCGYPRILSLTGLAIAGMFFTLFFTFYRETYTPQQRQDKLNLLKQQQLEQHNSSQQQLLDKINNNNNNNNNYTKNHSNYMKTINNNNIISSSNNNNNNNNIHHNYNQKLLEAKNR